MLRVEMAKTSIQRRLIASNRRSRNCCWRLACLRCRVLSPAGNCARRSTSQLRGRAMSIAALVRYSEDEHPHKLTFERGLVPPPLETGAPDLYEVVVTTAT